MSRRYRIAGALTAVVACAAATGTAAAARVTGAGTASSRCPWVHSTTPVATRVRQVLGRMSLGDKIGLVDGAGFSTGTAGYAGRIKANRALCIPALHLEDGPAGVADNVPRVTQLPAPVALAASWDPALARTYGQVIGSEDRGKGVDVNLGPTVNIVRDPRWGRAFESYGEDPYLSGQIAAGYIAGVQSKRVMAQVKHWAVYNQETHRNTPADDANVSQRAMREIYFPQFATALNQGAASVMCSYSTVDGQYACQNSGLANVLGQQWHFPGFVTSDWGATHSTVASANAGLDMQMPGGDKATDYFGRPLKHAVRDGRVRMKTLNGMVARILTEMFRFNLFAKPPQGSLTARVDTSGHARDGRRVERTGAVLLKNDGGVLPLRPGTSVAVIGSDAGRHAVTAGGGSASVTAPYLVTPRSGISQRAAASGVTVSYAQGDVPASGPLDTVPATAFAAPLATSYWNNTTMSGPPAVTGTATRVAFSWQGHPPVTGIRPTGWSARFTGTIRLPASGTYALSLAGTGTASVRINGRRAIATRPAPGGETAFRTVARASVRLPAGPARIEVDYADTLPFPAGGVTLGWAPPSHRPLLRQAVAAASQAKVAVVFAGERESEGADLRTISLPASVNKLISSVAAANPDTVVVLNTGSAVTMPWLGQVKGVIEAWYPGQDDGDEIASVLFGDKDPSGRLPVTFPASLSDVPAHTPAQWPGTGGRVEYSEGTLVGYRWYTTRHITPLFPFGYGLSYTTFAFSNLAVTKSSHGRVTVTAGVTNTGNRAGTDVAQVYVADPAATGEPAEQLRGFQRAALNPGQTTRVSVTLPKRAFAWWDSRAGGWTVTPGTYTVGVGDSSASLPLTAQVTLP
jgi:beta-glucosidase